MITPNYVNETLAGDMNKEMKLSYLEFTQDRLEELYEKGTITEADYEYMMKFTTNKAKELIKVLKSDKK